MMTTINDYIIQANRCEELGDRTGMFSALMEGFHIASLCENVTIDETIYELYYMLGFYYLETNINQAYLCFQNALCRCENRVDRYEIQATIDELVATGQVSVKDTLILIVSYNGQLFLQKCIESIRMTVPADTYRILVVDNASTDGVVDYLREQSDVELICNEENYGFSVACNQGVNLIKKIEPDKDYDIFLLNNDTRLANDSLFWLKMGLYRDGKTGATGAISNYAGNEQEVSLEFDFPNDYLKYGRENNVLKMDIEIYEDRVRLSGFAMLIRAGLWQLVGGMDEAFAPGYFEDDDLSMKISKAGYTMTVCKNSFVYHAGSQSFAKRDDVSDLLISHHHLFIEKYGFDILAFAQPDKRIAEAIPYGFEEEFNLLLLGSGLGADGKYISCVYPKANIISVESDIALRNISNKTGIVFDDLASLSQALSGPIFNVLVVTKRSLLTLDEKDMVTIGKVCLNDCIVIRQDKL